jgi:dephospho-CoA kinase
VGGIGSGKSTVAGMLRDLGCEVSESDALTREALREPATRALIREHWGEGIFGPDGEVDRARLAGIVFARPDDRRRLEAIIHPIVERRRNEAWSRASRLVKAFVIDAPLLLEAGLERECDAVIFVDAPPDLRRRRVEAARGWSAAELARRENAQMPLDRKREAADYVVVNTGDLPTLAARVRGVFDEIVRPSRTRS